jgi:hypothetical protein
VLQSLPLLLQIKVNPIFNSQFPLNLFSVHPLCPFNAFAIIFTSITLCPQLERVNLFIARFVRATKKFFSPSEKVCHGVNGDCVVEAEQEKQSFVTDWKSFAAFALPLFR